MLDGTVNPLGGGQAFVVDDFELTDDAVAVPEPATAWLVLVGLLGVARRRRCARTMP